MEATHSAFDFLESVVRIRGILDASDNAFEEKDHIPARSTLTFDNGFHVSASAMFIDMRQSKALADRYSKPKLAKIYRSYISESIAVMRGNSTIEEIYVEGDCVWGVFNTTTKPEIDGVFETGGRLSSLVDILNSEYGTRGVSPLDVGIGMTYGSALYIKAGHKGGGLNDVVWIGKLVAEAAQLCSWGNRTAADREMMVSNVFYNNLKDAYKAMLQRNYTRDCYHGDVVNSAMNEWLHQ